MLRHKLYFSCALSGLPLEHRQRMISLRESFRDVFDVLEFCDPKQVSPQGIYHHDIHHCVATADIMLAVVDERGTGLGYEMGVMLEAHNKPVLAVAQQDSVVSLFIIGITHPKYEIKRYMLVDEIRAMLIDFDKRLLS